MRLPGANLLVRGLSLHDALPISTVGGEREAAETVAAGGIGLRGEVGLALINVDNGDREGRRLVSSDDGGSDVVFCHRDEMYATNHRHVVGAVNGDGDELSVGAFLGHRGEAFF